MLKVCLRGNRIKKIKNKKAKAKRMVKGLELRSEAQRKRNKKYYKERGNWEKKKENREKKRIRRRKRRNEKKNLD